SRTIGWFTTIYPVLLNLEGATHPADALKSIKEQLRRIPDRGIGYGMLRYLCPSADTAQQLRDLPRAEVSFNYLGQFVQAEPTTLAVRQAREGSGPICSARSDRSYLLEITGSVNEGQLQLNWTYSQNVHQHRTINNLAQDFRETLRSLIAYCQRPDVGGHTPSDFSKARLSQKDLDRLASKINHPRGGSLNENGKC